MYDAYNAGGPQTLETCIREWRDYFTTLWVGNSGRSHRIRNIVTGEIIPCEIL